MKKSTWIIAVLLTLAPIAIWATQDGEDNENGSNSTPMPPLIMAQTLPGMRDLPKPSVRALPGMSSLRASAATFPTPLITDLVNYPNPVYTRKSGPEGQTTISYQLTHNAKVTLEIYDLLGYKVRGWNLEPGFNGGRIGVNEVRWDGTNEAGQKVSKGGYIAQIVVEAPEATVTVVRKIGVIH